MKVFVAGDAGCRQPKKGPIQVLVLNRCSFLRGNAGSIVALSAFDPGVLAFQDIPGFFVVEGLGVPLDEGKVFAIVVGVAASTFLARAGGDVIGCVKSPMRFEPARNFRMAFQALEGCLAAELVAGYTVGRSVQGLVGTR